jgi:hypothetical protein
MAFNPCDLVRASLRGTCSRRIVRHENQKDSCAFANTDSQTPEEKSGTHSIAQSFAETEESFANSVSKPDTEGQIKAKESDCIGDSCT